MTTDTTPDSATPGTSPGKAEPARAELVTKWAIFPTGCQPEDDEATHFMVEVTWRGNGRYSVDHLSSQLSRAGNWRYCVERFKRHQYRFDSLEDAQEWARRVVDDVTVNGRTWAQWQQWRADRLAQMAAETTPVAD